MADTDGHKLILLIHYGDELASTRKKLCSSLDNKLKNLQHYYYTHEVTTWQPARIGEWNDLGYGLRFIRRKLWKEQNNDSAPIVLIFTDEEPSDDNYITEFLELQKLLPKPEIVVVTVGNNVERLRRIFVGQEVVQIQEVNQLTELYKALSKKLNSDVSYNEQCGTKNSTTNILGTEWMEIDKEPSCTTSTSAYQIVSAKQRDEVERLRSLIDDEIKKVKTKVNLLVNKLEENNQVLDRLEVIKDTLENKLASQPSLKPSLLNLNRDDRNSSERGHEICVLRLESATKSFPSFEKEIEKQLNILGENMGKNQRSSFVKVVVKTVKGIDGISTNAKLVILSSYTPSVRLEVETVLPFYQLLQEKVNCPLMCVVLRYGESSSEAKIVDNTKPNNSPLSCFSVHFEGEALVKNTNTMRALQHMLSALGF